MTIQAPVIFAASQESYPVQPTAPPAIDVEKPTGYPVQLPVQPAAIPVQTVIPEGTNPMQWTKERQDKLNSLAIFLVGLFVCWPVHILNMRYKLSPSSTARNLSKASRILLWTFAVITFAGLVALIVAAAELLDFE